MFRAKYPHVAIVLLVLAMAGAGLVYATGNSPNRSGMASGEAYAPYISAPAPVPTPLPPRLQLDLLATRFDTDTITDIAHAGDDRLFIAEREGVVRIVRPSGAIDPAPFVDLRDDVAHEANREQGLLGLAFHPDYPAVPWLFVMYTDASAIRIARVTLDLATSDQVESAELETLIRIRKPTIDGRPTVIHNGGDLTFGPDGYLYIPVGDGGPYPGDPYNNAQRVDVMLGAILRIDVDSRGTLVPDCGGDHYSIPPDNPYVNTVGCDEIWATGLRNPWRIAFDPVLEDLYISDVGQSQREEVNVVAPGSDGGSNFGWRCYEGTSPFTASPPGSDPQCGPLESYTSPVLQYDHAQGNCSIIGGVVYQGAEQPDLMGRYVFGDFCSGRLWTMRRGTDDSWRADPAGQFPVFYSTFGIGQDGSVYVAGFDLAAQAVSLFRLELLQTQP